MPEASVATVTASTSAQGTPKAADEPVKTAPVAEPKVDAPKGEAKAAVETPKVEAKAEVPKETVYDIKLGKDSRVTAPEIEAVKTFAKQNGYSNDQAGAVATFLDAHHNKVREMVDGAWLDECKSSKTFGGEKYPESCQNIKTFLERVAPKLMPILDQSGYGNKVEVFEFLAEMASKSQDDKLVQGKQTVTQDNRSTLQKLEDSLNERYKSKK